MKPAINLDIAELSTSLNSHQINTLSIKPLNEKVKEESERDRILDFLSAAGKISTLLLAVTPLPTYLGVWNKPKPEQVQRVKSISFGYLLLNILCNSIWTSYAFKTQNIDLAIICVIPLVITIILTTIYLSVIPKTAHI